MIEEGSQTHAVCEHVWDICNDRTHKKVGNHVTMHKIILLDRDGVINQDSADYIKSIAEYVFLPGSIDAIARLTQAGYRIGIATNQSGIARGYYDVAMLEKIHAYMLTHIRHAGGDIAAIEYCPHHPDSHCACRKPMPGMLYALAQRLDCSLTDVPFVGDKLTDLQVAMMVQAQPIFLTTNPSETVKVVAQYPELRMYESLAQYVDALLALDP